MIDFSPMKLKAREADYVDGRLRTSAFFPNRYLSDDEFPHGAFWKQDGRYYSYGSDYRQAFRKLFGKASFCFHGSHYFHCWLLSLGRSQLLVLSAREHGTSYEWVEEEGVPEAVREAELRAFFLWLRGVMEADVEGWTKGE